MWSRAGFAFHHFSKWIFLVSLILLALLSIGGRALISNIEYFKTEIEQELADYGITGVALENIQGSWRGFHPILIIQGASLSIPGRSQALSINQLELSVKLIPSLINADLILESFHARVQKLILVRDKQGLWWLNDIPLTSLDDDSDTRVDIFALFQRLPDFVSIDIQLTQIRDLLNNVDYLIQKSSLNSSRIAEQLSLAFLAQLPATLGHRFEFYLKGDARKQQVYAKAKNLNLVRLLQLAGMSGGALSKARISVESWAELQNFRLLQMRNVSSLTQVLFDEKSAQKEPLNISFRQKIQKQDEGWRFDTIADRINRAGRQFSGFESQFLWNENNSKPALWLGAINLKELRTLLLDALSDETMRSMIDAMQPDATLHQLVAELDLEQLQQSVVGVDFSHLHSKAHQSIPGFDNLNGRLIAGQGNIRLHISPSAVNADFTSLLRTPIQFDEFSALIDMTLLDSGLLLQADSMTLANQDVRLRARAWLEAGKDGPPFLSLRAEYEDGKVSSTGKYLPVSIMPAKTVDWLDKSILGGQIPGGGLMFHGRLQKLYELEKNKSGEFHALFDVVNPEVRFLPDWPAASKGKGQASFHNTEMELSFAGVQFAAAKIDQVDLKIPDLMRAKLLIKGNTKARAEQVIDTLEAMPILKVAEIINQRKKRINGLVNTQLDVGIPLSPKMKQEISIKARADLQDVELAIPEWMIEFKKVNGVLEVENDRISATALKGLYYGDQAQLEVSTNSEKNRTKFILSGNLTSSKLATLLPDYLQQPVSGVSPWVIQVSVANSPSKKNIPVIISAHSDLSGTQLDFPEPFEVTARETQKLKFDATISSSDVLDFKTSLIDRVYASGQLNLLQGSSHQLSGLQMSFGSDLEMQKKTGFYLTGRINKLDMNDWNAYLNRFFKGIDDPSELLREIQAINLTVNEITLANQRAKESEISIQNNGFFLSGKIDSSIAKGTFSLPFFMDNNNPLTAELEYIRLFKSDVKNELKPVINDMPNLSVKSKKVSYEGMEFSDFILQTENAEDDFTIKRLDFKRDDVSLESSGHWHHETKNDEHVSVFNINIEGKQFGQAVSGLGLANTIRDGRVKFNGQIGWAGSLFDINWPSLIGEVELTLKDGYLINVDPGAGRLVGLMSFSALYKRLYLDFRDVLSEGMQFDEIKGKFNIKGDVMTTTNASMKGVSATVNVSGTTNLREKTYDQSMIIIPRVGDTLPVLGTLAAGSSVGWGLLLLQKIFKKPIDKSMEIEYKVGGSWENPEITLISKPEPVENENDDIFDEDS